MSYIQIRRNELGLTQAAAAAAAGMSRTNYQRVEQGLMLPGSQQARALEAVLGTPILSLDNIVRPVERRDLAGVALYQSENTTRATWAQAARLGGTHGLDSAVWSSLSTFLCSDSARECMALAQVAAAGGELRTDSPLLWGFDQHFLVNRHDRFLGARHLPFLLYQKGEVTLALWPQVRIRPADFTWCLDALTFYRNGRLRRWLDVEWDGRGHDPGNDLYRASQLRLPEVRITGQEIGAREVMQLLLQRAPQARIPDYSSMDHWPQTRR
ncbi:MAG: helix-turn-helix transcriptional regulator [Vulcanimicrobiota bacterium]